MSHIKENLEEIRARIAASAEKSGRCAEDVTLIAVTKTHPAEAINEAIACGVTDIGENKVQEIMDKYDKVTKGVLAKNVAAYKARLLEEWEELPPVFVTSSEKGLGREEVLGYIQEVNSTL